MPTYEVTSPDGKTWEVTAPDGATQDQIIAYAKQQWAASIKTPERPKETSNSDVASQAGLALRSAVKGGAAIPAMLADAVTGPLNFAQDKLIGPGRGIRFQQALPALDRALTAAGLPEPDTPTQRIVSKGVELGTGAGAAAKGAGWLAKGASGVARDVLTRLAANPETQVAAGIGSGLAGQQSAESGGGAGSQFVSSLVGGLGGAGIAGGIKSAAGALAQRNAPQLQPVEIERRITAILERQGIDPASITPAMKQALMADVQKALKLPGGLNEQAVARLADYRRLGLTPTRGRVTLDPFDVTQEQNAMRMAAATGARDARLPQIAQGNNAGLLGAVEDLRPINDRVTLGERVTAPIMARDASLKARVDSLYGQARDTAGRSADLDRAAFTTIANERLDQALVGGKLPADVANLMNWIAKNQKPQGMHGSIPMPFNVDIAEQLKTRIGDLQRASRDGGERTALGIVRQALEETPLMSAPKVNPGNLPAVPGTVPPSQATLGQESIDAFNAARTAARQRFGWQEATPAIARTLDGAAPDNFIQREIISKTAAAADVARLAAEVAQVPQAQEAIRSGIVQHLKDAAIGRGNSAQTANFSGRQWLSALSEIGDQKLRAFFSPAEVEQLKAIGRVGATETFQPRGSAVNNSNTAAGVAGLLQGLSKNLGPLINKIPGGQSLVSPAMDNLTLSFTERGLTNVPRGLMTPPQAPPGSLLDPMLLPGLVGGGLLTAP